METTPSSQKFMRSMENPFQGTDSGDIQDRAAAQLLVNTLHLRVKNKSNGPLSIQQFVELIDEQGKKSPDFLQNYTRMFKRCSVFINEIYGSDLPLKTSTFGHQKASLAIKYINTMTYEYIRRSTYGEMEIIHGGFDALDFTFGITHNEGCGDQNCSCDKTALELYLGVALVNKNKLSDKQNIAPLFSTVVYL